MSKYTEGEKFTSELACDEEGTISRRCQIVFGELDLEVRLSVVHLVEDGRAVSGSYGMSLNINRETV